MRPYKLFTNHFYIHHVLHFLFQVSDVAGRNEVVLESYTVTEGCRPRTTV